MLFVLGNSLPIISTQTNSKSVLDWICYVISSFTRLWYGSKNSRRISKNSTGNNVRQCNLIHITIAMVGQGNAVKFYPSEIHSNILRNDTSCKRLMAYHYFRVSIEKLLAKLCRPCTIRYQFNWRYREWNKHLKDLCFV